MLTRRQYRILPDLVHLRRQLQHPALAQFHHPLTWGLEDDRRVIAGSYSVAVATATSSLRPFISFSHPVRQAANAF